MTALISPLSFKSASDLRARAAADGVVLLDLAFTDARGRGGHIGVVPEALPDKGPFTAGGLVLAPDLSCVVRDPFAAQGTYRVLCSGAGPDARAVLAAQGASLRAGTRLAFTFVEPGAGPDARAAPEFAESPADAYVDIRGEVVTVLRAMGVPAEWHHHAGGPPGAGVMGLAAAPLLAAADGVVLARYALANVAASYGKRAEMGAMAFVLLAPEADWGPWGPALAAVLHPCAGAYRAPLPSPPAAGAACNPYLALLALAAASQGPAPAPQSAPEDLPAALEALAASNLLPGDLVRAYAGAFVA